MQHQQLKGVPFIHPSIMARLFDNPEGCADTSERERQEIALRIASPKRADAGAQIAPQADAADLPLFIHANEPKLF